MIHKVIGPPLCILISPKCLIFKSLVTDDLYLIESESLRRSVVSDSLHPPGSSVHGILPLACKFLKGKDAPVCVCVCVCLSGLTSDSYKVDAYVYESECGIYRAKQLLRS